MRSLKKGERFRERNRLGKMKPTPMGCRGGGIDGEKFSQLVALGLGISWVVNFAESTLPYPPYIVPPWMIGLLVFGAFDTYLVLRSARSAGWVTLLFVVLVGVGDRLLRYPGVSSDVLAATREALGVLFSGNNPYLHTFSTTVPTGSPFPYLPGELLFYALPSMLFHSIDGVDKMVGIATIFLIASLAPMIGTARASLCTAFYATSNLAALNSVNGSNDGSQAFLLIVSMALLAWSKFTDAQVAAKACFYASAVFLAWALLFKALSWVFLPFIASYLFTTNRVAGRRYLAMTGILFTLAVLPFLILSPSGFLGNISRGFTLHTNIWGLDVWAAFLNAGLPMPTYEGIIPCVAFLVIVTVFIALLKKRSASVGEALMRGLGVFTAALLVTRWSSPDYYAFGFGVFTAAIALIAVPAQISTRGAQRCL